MTERAPDEDRERYGERTLAMARAIYDAYGTLNDWPTDWDATDGTISDDTRAKYLAIADDVMDKIEWTTFRLSPADRKNER